MMRAMAAVMFVGFVGIGLIARQSEADPFQSRDTPTQASPGTATIGGTLVSDDGSSKPVRRARVTLSGGVRSPSLNVTTDDLGRFNFRSLRAGRYTLQAKKAAWLDVTYGANRPGRPGTAITLADGQQFTNATMMMARGAVITGVIRDQGGAPAQGARVTVLQYRLGYGERVLIAAWGGTADDRGVYRAFGLSPGDSLVAATMSGPTRMELHEIALGEVEQAQQAIRQGLEPASHTSANRTAAAPAATPAVSYAPVFYPGTTDVANAGTITVGPGEERSDVNISLQFVPTARVSGMVSVPQGMQADGVQLNLTGGEPRLPANVATNNGSAHTAKDGTFSFAGIAPGHYEILAQAFWPMPSEAQGRPVQRLFARADISVLGQDVIAPLVLQPAMTLTGHVVFDGGPPPKDQTGLRFSMATRGLIQADARTSTLDANGQFTFGSMLPGKYQFIFDTGPSTPWWITSSVIRGQETLDGPIEIRAGEDITDWVVRLTDRPSEIAGTLQDPTGHTAPDYFIIVFTSDKTYWTTGSRRVRQARPAMDGTFSIKGLPAGTYLIAALTDVEPGEWYTPAFLEQLVGLAVKVTIVDGEKTVQDLRIK